MRWSTKTGQSVPLLQLIAAGDPAGGAEVLIWPALPGLRRAVRRTHARPGDNVIKDNLCSHKGKAVRQAIRRSGARLLFLPPYGPNSRSQPNRTGLRQVTCTPILDHLA